MDTTATKVLQALQAYGLKPQSQNEYRLNSPLRSGSNSHGFTLHVHPDGEHGTWFDHVSGEKGSLYQLAEKLGIQPTRLEQPVPTSKRAFSGLTDYAAAHGITAEQLAGFYWAEAEYKGKLALRFKTQSGDRWRLLQGSADELKAPYRNQPGKFKACWYGLNSGTATLIEMGDDPLIIANGEISAVVGQCHGLAAVAVSGGEKEIADELIVELKDFFKGKLPAVLIAADCDPTGRKFARINAQKLIATGFPDVKALDLGLSKGGDLADLCRMYGKQTEEVLPMLPELRHEELPQPHSEKMVLYSRQDLKNLPPVEWLIPDVIPKRGITIIYGASGEYKTYLALDYACTLSQENSVIYLAAEGQNGLDSRITAWESHHHLEANPYFYLKGLDILDSETREEFIHLILRRKPQIAFIDTLGQTMRGDLNNSRDVQDYLRACMEIAAYFDGAIVLIHHKNKSGGEHGSGYLRNNVDIMLEVSRLDDVIRIECTKTKYTQQPEPRYMKPVTVGSDVVLVDADKVIVSESDPLTIQQLKAIKVLAMDAFTSGATVQELLDMERIPSGSVYRVLNNLLRLGFALKRGKNKWAITESGRQKLLNYHDHHDNQAIVPLVETQPELLADYRDKNDNRKTQYSEGY